MKLHSLIVDDFLPDFEDWRGWADTCAFGDVTNPADDVTYPLICTAVPSFGMQARLSGIMNGPVSIRSLFLRLSPAGVPAPHQAHSDTTMGRYTAIVYLNRPEHCQGGTSLVRHVSGFERTPTTAEQFAAWQRDMNTPDRWEPTLVCPMTPNRAFIFDSDLMHRAEPTAGFGTDATDGRLIMCAFYDCP